MSQGNKINSFFCSVFIEYDWYVFCFKYYDYLGVNTYDNVYMSLVPFNCLIWKYSYKSHPQVYKILPFLPYLDNMT